MSFCEGRKNWKSEMTHNEMASQKNLFNRGRWKELKWHTKSPPKMCVDNQISSINKYHGK